MEIGDGHLYLNSRPGDRSQYTPIDFFFRSLAGTVNSAAIGVVLLGSSSDGAAGLREIKKASAASRSPKTRRRRGTTAFPALPSPRARSISCAGDMHSALEAAREQVDVVVCNIGLPDGTGFDVMRRISADHLSPLKPGFPPT
jgi:CheY-like chemotaxis protein